MWKIDSGEDIIDSRQVIERIEELRALADDEEVGLDEEEAEELAALEALAAKAEPYAADWNYGEALIRETYFVEFAKEQADDLVGDQISSARWPFMHIDWDEAADDLKTDYTEVEFCGVTHLIR